MRHPMRARSWWVAAVLAVSTVAAADPKPKAVDIKSFKDQLLVLTDSDGAIYVVHPTDARVWFGTAKSKNLYEQVKIGTFRDGTREWDFSVWAPRVPNVQPGSIHKKDNEYLKWCGSNQKVGLTELTGDKAKAVLDKWTFWTTAMIRRPYILARDDSGVYYYVDVIRNEYGGKGYRVFIGKKGAMKQRPLSDIAIDTAGDVFATKTGDLRIVREAGDQKSTVTWVRGEKRSPLVWLDTDANSPLIYKDLGIYTFTGSICETL